jgi:hypothetical protein
VNLDDVIFGDLADQVNEVHTVSSDQPQKPILRTLPDKGICRASILTERFAECLVDKPAPCPYAMPFGYGYLCGHPDRETIISDTTSSQEPDRPVVQ